MSEKYLSVYLREHLKLGNFTVQSRGDKVSGYLEMDLTDEFEQDIIGIYWSDLNSYEFAERMIELVEKYRDKEIRSSARSTKTCR